MNLSLLALGIATAATCINPGASATGNGNVVTLPVGNQNGQCIVINGNTEEGQDQLKELLKNCGIRPDSVLSYSCPNGSIVIAGSSCPDTSRPGQSVPETNTPETSAPDSSTPETSAPDNNAPETTTPDNDAPETSAPDNDTPETSAPKPDAPETQPPADSAEDADASSEDVHPYVLRIVELVNEARAEAGLPEVVLDTAASQAAQVRAREIVRSFSHTRPDGQNFSTALTEQDVMFRSAGENIAWGQRTPEQVMDAWMNSPGHRANILRETFTHIGVGYYQENGTNYWAQLFFR